jgi:transposase
MKLQDSQWKKLEPLMIGKHGDPGVKGRDNRLFIDAVLWIVGSRSVWRKLPSEFGNWNTTYMRFRRWNACDIWRQLEQDMYDNATLKSILHEIVIYGDQRTESIRKKLARRVKKQAYYASLGKADGSRKAAPGTDNST